MKLPPTQEFDVASRTDTGRLRNSNQDHFGEGERPHGHWFVVADGMGGHAGGATASRMAVQAILEGGGGSPEPDARLRHAFEVANQKIHQKAQDDSRFAGMGTTAVALAFEKGRCWVGNVGDSRAYRLRGGQLEAVSEDHSVVAEFVRRGYIDAAVARNHPRRNELLRSLGTSAEVEVDVDPVDAAPGDTFMLCSDGLCGVVEDDAIAEILGRGTASDAAEVLIAAANKLGGPDNITVQVIRIPQAETATLRIAGDRVPAGRGAARRRLVLRGGPGMIRGSALAALLLVFLVGCATPLPDAAATPDRSRALGAALQALGPEASAREAARLADEALATTRQLHERYRPVRPALFGNAAFHLGLRDRALCCHWAEDLLRSLAALELDSFALHWGVAHYGNPLREHSAVVVVARGGRFEEGLVLDAWRRSGRLYWVRVDRDRYPWKPHPADEQRDRLRCSDDR